MNGDQPVQCFSHWKQGVIYQHEFHLANTGLIGRLPACLQIAVSIYLYSGKLDLIRGCAIDGHAVLGAGDNLWLATEEKLLAEWLNYRRGLSARHYLEKLS